MFNYLLSYDIARYAGRKFIYSGRNTPAQCEDYHNGQYDTQRRGQAQRLQCNDYGTEEYVVHKVCAKTTLCCLGENVLHTRRGNLHPLYGKEHTQCHQHHVG